MMVSDPDGVRLSGGVTVTTGRDMVMAGRACESRRKCAMGLGEVARYKGAKRSCEAVGDCASICRSKSVVCGKMLSK